MLLYGFVVSNVGAALRLGMIQHFEGQKIIHNLKPLMTKIVKENSNKAIEEMWQFSPQIEINQMSHEEMDSKMFIT
jgi:urease accessory protein